MSGKSTLLRTVGVNVVLAQTVNTCMATVYDAPVLTVRSIIGRGDDLMSGTSYYRDEMEAALTLVHCSRSRLPHLFLFDELFRGAITVERIAAGEAVLLELLSHHEDESAGPPHIVIAATHDRELVDLLRPGMRLTISATPSGLRGCRSTTSCERACTVSQRHRPARDAWRSGAPGSARAQAVGGPRRPASSRPSDRDRGDTGLASRPW
jgi:hypothetical protein